MVKNENPVRDRKNNIKYTGSVKKPDAVKKIDTVNDKKPAQKKNCIAYLMVDPTDFQMARMKHICR